MPTVVLHNAQARIWHSPARYKVIRCGRRFGKTLYAITRLLHRGLSEPGLILWYVAPTYKQAKLIAWALLKASTKGINPPVLFNEQELKATLPNGSIILLMGADNPDSLRGTYVDELVMDEIDFFSSWTETWKVIRPLIADKKAPVTFCSTPNGFRNLYELEQTAITDETGQWAHFHFTSHDNPHIDSSELEQMQSEMTEEEYRQEILAQYERPSGIVYSNWPDGNFRPCPYDEKLPVHISMDFGWDDALAIGWFQPHQSETRLIDYFEGSKIATPSIANIIKSKPYRAADLICGDQAGKATQSNTGTSVIEELARYGIFVMPVDNKDIPNLIRVAGQTMATLIVNSAEPNTHRFRDCLINYRYPKVRETAMNQQPIIPIHDEYSHGMRMYEYYRRSVAREYLPKVLRPKVTYTQGDPYTGFGRKAVVHRRSSIFDD